MPKEFDISISASHKRILFEHLFPGDGGEHGAVLAAGMIRTKQGLRLLVRGVERARDGVDYLPGERGYRMLAGAFVTDQIRRCRDEKLVYLAVHNHGGTDRVGFSALDLESHRRGYPALLDISRGVPVGALVFARGAAAGELWLSKTDRIPLREFRVVGASFERLHPAPPRATRTAAPFYDRQARLFGDAGQALLGQMKIGVIGAGGVGSLLVQSLARLGVGHLVVVDPERIEPSNVSRIVESTLWDALAPLDAPWLPDRMRRYLRLLSRRKVDVMRRIARRANPNCRVEVLYADFTERDVARRFRDCDFLFLAADKFQARLVFNAIVHQYLVPGYQVGSKVPVDARSGEVGDVYSVSRPVYPDSGCLWCNGLIPAARLQEEAATDAECRAQRYVEEETVVAPSVITLNARGAAAAVDGFLFAATGFRRPSTEPEPYERTLQRDRLVVWDEPRMDEACSECGSGEASRYARGDGVDLPAR